MPRRPSVVFCFCKPQVKQTENPEYFERLRNLTAHWWPEDMPEAAGVTARRARKRPPRLRPPARPPARPPTRPPARRLTHAAAAQDMEIAVAWLNANNRTQMHCHRHPQPACFQRHGARRGSQSGGVVGEGGRGVPPLRQRAVFCGCVSLAHPPPHPLPSVMLPRVYNVPALNVELMRDGNPSGCRTEGGATSAQRESDFRAVFDVDAATGQPSLDGAPVVSIHFNGAPGAGPVVGPIVGPRERAGAM